MTGTTTARPKQTEFDIEPRGRLAAGRRQLGIAFLAAGVGMMPWLVVLTTTLPATARAVHWNIAWVGLDGAEGCFLVATGVLVIRQDTRSSLTTAVTATLVLTDAWFDVLTSAAGAAEITALVLAACVEVPVATLCATFRVRTFPERGNATQC